MPQGGGSSGSGVKVLGPYTVAFNSSGVLIAPGHVLTALTVNEWILESWVQVRTQFSGGGSASIIMELATDGANSAVIADFEVGQTSVETFSGADLQQSPSAISGHPGATPLTSTRMETAQLRVVPARVAVACNICAGLFPDVGAPTAGSADVWFLVAT